MTHFAEQVVFGTANNPASSLVAALKKEHTLWTGEQDAGSR